MTICESCGHNQPATETVTFHDGDPFRVCHTCADDAVRWGCTGTTRATL